jgi:hypothetical protein
MESKRDKTNASINASPKPYSMQVTPVKAIKAIKNSANSRKHSNSGKLPKKRFDTPKENK